MKYYSILNTFEFGGSRAKVKVTVAFFRKRHCHCSSTFIYGPILLKFKFQLSRAKVNVKVAIHRNMLLAVQFFHLWINFDIHVTSYKFQVWQHLG